MGGLVLTATSVGYRVARLMRDGPVRARVRATFEHACHLLTDGGELLTLLEGDRRGPMTAIVPGLAAALGAVDVGLSATLTAGALVLAPATLRVDLPAAAVWERPAPPGRPLADRDARHAWVREARAMALRRQEPGFMAWLDGGIAAGAEGEGRPDGAGSLATIIERRGRAAIGELAAALRAGDVGGAGAAAEALIGLGPGLTPAGDDLLTGLLLTLRMACPAPDERPAWLGELARRVVARAEEGTTLAGRQQLRLAAQGEADEVTLRAATAMLWGTEEDRAPIEALLAVGHSSGADLLAGICLAVERPAAV